MSITPPHNGNPTHLKARRYYPKLQLSLPLTILLEGQQQEYRTLDINLDQLRIRCTKAQRDSLIPSATPAVPGAQIHHSLQLTLPEQQIIPMVACIQTSRRQTQHFFEIIFKLIDLEAQHRHQLSRYLDQQLSSNPHIASSP